MYQLNVPNMKDSFSSYLAEEECKIEIRNDDNIDDSKGSEDEDIEIDPHEWFINQRFEHYGRF